MPVDLIATYRCQLTPSFGFDAVVHRLDHLVRLGVSHVYLSPIAQAVPESQHGYDVVDHTEVRAEFGGAAAFDRLLDAVADRSMAVVIDHVPNHVASTRPDLNPPWWGLLRDGPGSDGDRWFDVDWEAGGGKVILPVLGAPLSEVLAAGDVVLDGDALVLYGERRLPLALGTADADLAEVDLADVVDAQHYDLRHWRDPARNVRRFFTIDDLVAVRVEHADVAETVDTLPARYAGHAGFGGVRVDHVDGLADPLGYLTGLRARIGDDTLLWVEKIVAPGEWLPTSWPVDGTTGYEFIRACDHVLLAADAVGVFDRAWREASGDDRSFHAWEADARREVVDGALAPDLARVRRVAARATGRDEAEIADELATLTTELPRYRTYLPDDPDAADLIGALADGPVARAILAGGGDTVDTEGAVELRTRWQQLTGPVMAKGAEDRSFYRYLRLASACEVGGDPARFGLGVDEFHADNARRARAWPQAMLAGSTHDTKRSDDVRARSAAWTWRAAAEPDEVATHLGGWVDELAGRAGVDAVSAMLAAQTVVTTPGLDAARLTDYLVKASREAALRTTWEDPDTEFEERLAELAALAASSDPEPVLRLDTVAAGLSLVATALRLTSPGVADVYQGSEAFTYRLVDPDNRVPPDWDALAAASADRRDVATAWSDGAPEVKTILVTSVLELRRRRYRSLGPDGDYRPIEVGPGAIAYARGRDVVVVARRGSAEVDHPMALPEGTWYDVLDPAAPALSGTIDAASACGSGEDGTLPLAVFERE